MDGLEHRHGKDSGERFSREGIDKVDRFFEDCPGGDYRSPCIACPDADRILDFRCPWVEIGFSSFSDPEIGGARV